MTKEEAKEKIKLLIDKFNSQIEFYKSLNYNETKTRQDFINPFFKALGWDIDNDKQILETYRNVSHEDKIKVNGHTKSPDYSFGINGKRIFFVEAKRPAVPIRENPEPALQVRNYGWNAKLSISIVTDFEEFAIYDCTRKPKPTENANTKRLKYIYFTDYLKEFDFIYDTFSYENVENNSIEKYAKSKINYKTAEPVDKEFLKSIEKWREGLAANIAFRNRDLEEEEINFSVQQIIDRIVFLKVCEDRKVESENNLFFVTKSGYYYQNLYEYFQKADQKYNSGLFDFKKDTITKDLEIDNTVIKNIIIELYGKSQITDKEYGYNFAIIPVEILGMAYEQFLGKVIRLTTAHQAKIEEKPEVRKAGGVFYTPEYIVEYIVKNTVGKLIENKTPDEISKIKIIDPSCGSGSFLLGAYQYLLDYHLNYYDKNREKLKPKDNPLTPDGKLTKKEKKRVLLNNIFGVDIDTQAVEVSKLSLLLKALEGETETSIHTSLQLFNERVLPTIDSNIQCGNSLIASDFYDTELFLTPKEERKINVFDWENAFPDILKYGGFDCVIGNPPYGASFQNYEKKYLKTKYPLTDIEFESYLLFIQKSIVLLKENGYHSYIVPSNLLTNLRYEKTRLNLLQNSSLKFLIDLGAHVFEQASVDTCVFICKKEIQKENLIRTFSKNINELKDDTDYTDISQNEFLLNSNYIFNIYKTKEQSFLEQKIENGKCSLSNLVSFARGIEFGYKSEYITLNSNEKNAKPILAGRCIQRYRLKFENKYVLFNENDSSNFKTKEIYETEKILIRRIGTEIIAVYDNNHFYNVCDVYNIILKSEINLKYILALLNSKLLSFYLKTKFQNAKKLFPKIPIKYLEKLPIKEINLKSKTEKQLHDQIVKLAETMLDLNDRLQKAKIQTDKNQLLIRINHFDKEIDKFVYQLYDLSLNEILIIDPNFTI